MIEPGDIRPLSDFQRNAKASIRRLRRTGRPEVLTVNGKAAVVVQDAAAYAAAIQRLEDAYTAEAVRIALEQVDAGETRPFAEFEREFRARHGAPRRKRRSA